MRKLWVWSEVGPRLEICPLFTPFLKAWLRHNHRHPQKFLHGGDFLVPIIIIIFWLKPQTTYTKDPKFRGLGANAPLPFPCGCPCTQCKSMKTCKTFIDDVTQIWEMFSPSPLLTNINSPLTYLDHRCLKSLSTYLLRSMTLIIKRMFLLHRLNTIWHKF
jgi:hypothetical protein